MTAPDALDEEYVRDLIARAKSGEHCYAEAVGFLITTGNAILSALASHAAVREKALEEAARLIDTEFERVLSKQTGKPQDDSVDLNIRMVAVLLPDLANRIRALKEPT